ncbi:transcription antitermination protein NusG [Escherichia coli]|uniref:Transcription antitermination protein NusG n=1 Tax=Escherichia coli TaxID=562 RepID=A0A376L5B5_ECOLX|nr:transcription antitermination protein NusG [Escherichia coli]
MSEAPKKRWYVVQAFSGFEGRVATSLRGAYQITQHGRFVW